MPVLHQMRLSESERPRADARARRRPLLAESGAILCYLADGTPLVPDGPWQRAEALQWMFFEQYRHEPHIAVARFWTHCAADGGFDLAPYPALRAWIERVAAQPRHVTLHAS